MQGYILDAQICEEPLVCNVDKGQLLRVFENLTGNFFKYTPQGSTLRFGVEREGNKARISLADNGPGINEESKADVFEAFVVGENRAINKVRDWGLRCAKDSHDARRKHRACKRAYRKLYDGVCRNSRFARRGREVKFVATTPAKLNLSLAITGKKDGLHTLDMIVYPFEKYADKVEFCPDEDKVGFDIKIAGGFDGLDETRFLRFANDKLQKSRSISA